jgi:acyl carrier protein
MIQQRYGRLPFAEYLEELGQRPVEERDVTVADLVAFICEHRQPTLEEVRP